LHLFNGGKLVTRISMHLTQPMQVHKQSKNAQNIVLTAITKEKTLDNHEEKYVISLPKFIYQLNYIQSWFGKQSLN
jgi:hypothetical protein